ncbi:hypothetical protein O181_077524 [Austropuccinia psidii MF-1]|uniref:Uncharacterized protein n=1 Tax=Austropuccinia psidii MF-1 TaxID=1389203 RepID=A0A9Q3FEM9_9BASI|nr:hypothetical protein [Austropuccinia psidii MF-1]
MLTLCRTFAIFQKLIVKADELEGLLVQDSCHALPTLDQLVTATILVNGKEKPLLTFMSQVILNAFQKKSDSTQCPSTLIYHVSNLLETAPPFTFPCSPHPTQPM